MSHMHRWQQQREAVVWVLKVCLTTKLRDSEADWLKESKKVFALQEKLSTGGYKKTKQKYIWDACLRIKKTGGESS